MISSVPKKYKAGAKPTDAQEMIQVLMTYRQQLHIYHWQTPSYARHKASDDLLEKLSDFIDKFMEIYFGKYGKVNITVPINITLENMNDAQGVIYLDIMTTYFEDKLTTYLDAKDTDLVNLRDEILAATKQAKYLYTLQ
jgi:hypothetical protein